MRKMMLAAVAAGAALACAQPAAAGPFTDGLSRCLVTKATDEDKQGLVIWIFASIGEHPQVKGYVNMTDADRARLSKNAAQVMQRLIVKDCRKETQEAIRYEGQGALGSAFEVLGSVAMTDLTENPDVARSMESFASYFDEKALEAVVSDTGTKK